MIDGTIQNGSVVGGVVTWGYLLPFFLSNLIANIYGFYQNKKTTFKSDAPWYSFAFYIVLMIALILFSTWFQGWLVGIIAKINWAWIQPLARTIAGLAARKGGSTVAAAVCNALVYSAAEMQDPAARGWK